MVVTVRVRVIRVEAVQVTAFAVQLAVRRDNEGYRHHYTRRIQQIRIRSHPKDNHGNSVHRWRKTPEQRLRTQDFAFFQCLGELGASGYTKGAKQRILQNTRLLFLSV